MTKREKIALAVVLVVAAVVVYIDHQNTQECLRRGGAELVCYGIKG
jgi:hypothetical protein